MKRKPRPLRILVVDDDEKIQRLLQLILRQQGHVAETASSGQEALRLLNAAPFDLLILDIQLPGMDGLQLTREILALHPWQEIIFCTGFLNEVIQQKAREFGVKILLEKPLSLNLIRHALRQTRCLRDLQANAPPSNPDSLLASELGALRHLSRSYFPGLDIEALLRDAVALAFHQLDCRSAALLVVREEEAHLRAHSSGRLPAPERQQLTDSLRARYTSLSGLPVPETCHPLFHSDEPSPLPPTAPPHLCFIPIPGENRLLGLLAIADLSAHPSPPFLQLLSHHLASLLLGHEHCRNALLNDPVTGLYGPRFLDESLERHWLLAQRHREGIAILLAQIDGFRSLQHDEGPDRANALLRGAASLLADSVRRSDILARTGTGEFLLLLPRASADSVRTLADRLRTTFRNTPLDESGRSPPATLSIGFALSTPEAPMDSAGLLLECAGQALQIAQSRGGNLALDWAHTGPDSPPPPSAHNLLVVDDDPQVLHLVRRILHPSLFEVTAMHSVASGIAMLESGNRFDLLLADLTLPDGEGGELIQRAAAIDPTLVAMVISGNISRSKEESLLASGAWRVIRKPFVPREFRETLGQAVEHRTLLLRQSADSLPTPSPQGASGKKTKVTELMQ